MTGTNEQRGTEMSKRYPKPAEMDTALVFESYFGCADEIYDDGWGRMPGGNDPLTLDDLDKRFVAEAREAASRLALPWPPHLPTAEEYLLDHPELRIA